jgi:hypothetical protein
LRAKLARFGVVGAAASFGTHRIFAEPQLIRAWFDGWCVICDLCTQLVVTAICIAPCFREGAVKPLFAIGAKFADASNTRFSTVVSGIEIFTTAPASKLAVVCVVAYLSNGHIGIHTRQVIEQPKHAQV